MMAVFDNHGVRFSYPSDWTLEDRSDDQDCAEITVANAETAFWTITLHDWDVDPERLIAAAVEAIQGEYEDVETEVVVADPIAPHMQGCDINFCCLDLTNTACIRGFRSLRASCLVIYQAEDREFEVVRPSFDAILSSLICDAG